MKKIKLLFCAFFVLYAFVLVAQNTSKEHILELERFTYEHNGEQSKELALAYEELGEINAKMSQPFAAIQFFEKASNIYASMGNESANAELFFKVGNVYYDGGKSNSKNYNSAAKFYLRALSSAESAGQKSLLPKLYEALESTERARNNPTAADNYKDKRTDILANKETVSTQKDKPKENKTAAETQVEIANLQKTLKSGNLRGTARTALEKRLKEALARAQYLAAKDSLNRMTFAEEKKKQEEEIQAGKQENERLTNYIILGSILGIIFLVTGGVITLLYLRLDKAKKVLSITNKELTKKNTKIQEQKQEIEGQNTELHDKTVMLNQQKEELQSALDHLREAQAQLIQAEKMASLGQLVAGIAHEVNTPLGAIRASAENIANSLSDSLKSLPQLFEKLTIREQQDFFALTEQALQSTQVITSKEQRAYRKQVAAELEDNGVENTAEIADILTDMGIYEGIEPFRFLFRHPDISFILQTAYDLVMQQKNTSNIRTAVDKAAKVVFALKHYARYEQGSEKLLADITEGIETVLTLYQNSLKHNVELSKHFQPLPQIYCYPDELNQVWTNLISNGLQAMHHKGKLDIETFQKDGHIIVNITDSGDGIPLEVQSRIFEPFFTTKPAGEGSGLGLGIVQKIVEKHNGTISFETEKGKTTFSVVLPA